MTLAAEASAPSRPRRATALLVAGALFMEMLDATIIATALPSMARSFGASAAVLNLGMTAYLLALAACIPLSGWLSARAGPRRVFVGAVAAFSLASLACALSTRLAPFVVARILQGAAAALVTPVGRLVVLREAPRSDLVRTIAWLTWPAVLAPAIAPPLGGLIVQHASWRWIFLLNLPLGAIAAVAAWRLLPDSHPGGRPAKRLDLRGLALWAPGLALIMAALELAVHLPPATVGLIAAAGLALGAAAVRHFRRVADPVLDLSALRRPTFAFNIGWGSLCRTAILANPFLLPVFFQLGLGMSPAASGGLLFLGALGNLGMKFLSTAVLRRFAFRAVLLWNGVLMAASFAAFALVGRQTPHGAIAGLLVLSGLARSLQFTCLNTIAFADVPPRELDDANVLYSTAQQLNGGLGVAVAALSLQVSARLLGSAADLAPYRASFLAAALIGLAGALGALRLPRSAGAGLARPGG